MSFESRIKLKTIVFMVTFSCTFMASGQLLEEIRTPETNQAKQSGNEHNIKQICEYFPLCDKERS